MSRIIWEEIMDGIDETLIDEALGMLRSDNLTAVQKELSVVTADSGKRIRFSAVRSIAAAAAAFAVIIGAGFLIKNILFNVPDTTPPISAGASRFEAYDFNACSDPVVYNSSELPELTGIPKPYEADGEGEYAVPYDRSDLVAYADLGVVVTIKEAKITDISPAENSAEQCVYTAEVHYTAFGEYDETKNIKIFTLPKLWGTELDTGADYFLILRGYADDMYKLCGGIGSVFGINEDFTVTALSPFRASKNYEGLSLADLVHDLKEAFDNRASAEKEIYPLEKIYSISEHESETPLNITFEMPEFAGEELLIYRVFDFDDQNMLDHIYANGYANGEQLLKCDALEEVYLSDINGDGLREICCSAYKNGNEGIFVYDYSSKKLYQLFDGQKAFELSEKDGALWVNTGSGLKKLSTDLLFPVIIDDSFNIAFGSKRPVLNGEPVPFSLLKGYPVKSRSDALRISNEGSKLSEFLKTVNVPDIEELYFRAYDLTYPRETDLLAAFTLKGASVTLPDTGMTFYETGYTSESFYNALRSVFSSNMVKQVLNSGCYYSYNGGLYVRDSGSGIRKETGAKYELIYDNGYNEISFRKTAEFDGEVRSASCKLNLNEGKWKFSNFSATGIKRIDPNEVSKGYRIISWSEPCWISAEPTDYTVMRDGSLISLITGEKSEYCDILLDPNCKGKEFYRKEKGEALNKNGETDFPYEAAFYSSKFRRSYNDAFERCAVLTDGCPDGLYEKLISENASAKGIKRDEIRLVYAARRIEADEYEEFYADMPEIVFSGDAIPFDELEIFGRDEHEYEYVEQNLAKRNENADRDSDSMPIGQFLEYLDKPELIELYQNIVYLVAPTDYIGMTDRAAGTANELSLLTRRENCDIGQKHYDVYISYENYQSSGYTFESYLKLWQDTFTNEALEKYFNRGANFAEYNGELYYQVTSGLSPYSSYERAYEILQNDDSAIRFRFDSYFTYEEGFDPERLDDFEGKYTKQTAEIRFVNTDEGWKSDYIGGSLFNEPEGLL